MTIFSLNPLEPSAGDDAGLAYEEFNDLKTAIQASFTGFDSGENAVCATSGPDIDTAVAEAGAALPATGGDMTGVLGITDGTAVAPALDIASTAGMGFYKSDTAATDWLGVANGGQMVGRWWPSGLEVAGGVTIGTYATIGTRLVVAGEVAIGTYATIGTALQVGTQIELGQPSDTTLTRSAAGVVAVEGNDLVSVETGTFSISTWQGFTGGDPDISFAYKKMGNVVTLYETGSSTLTATSNSGFFSTATADLPEAIRPTIEAVMVPVVVVDNGNIVMGVFYITNSGQFTLEMDAGSGIGNNFTSSGTKGLTEGFCVTYALY